VEKEKAQTAKGVVILREKEKRYLLGSLKKKRTVPVFSAIRKRNGAVKETKEGGKKNNKRG